ncbi:hypothetical protein KSF_027920 [Reticulibacter mediterranei]|uniref:Uncharacterized protein n=2 Tax=Reticulibacter mediterranei TaxID=2778369 RepID=A0A8J3IC78_9CHLR|nr:hypothetical protein KSF_027920 [Reticulibacter mediterranei]
MALAALSAPASVAVATGLKLRSIYEAYYEGGGGGWGFLNAINQVNPVYLVMESGNAVWEAASKGDCRTAGREMVSAATGVVSAGKVAVGGAKLASSAAGFVAGLVQWVKEKATMSKEARAYNDGAPGKTVDPVIGETLTPALNYKDANGNIKQVRFDGQDGNILVDRKVSVTRYPKARRQAFRQSQALDQNDMTGCWEVPTEAAAEQARNMLAKLGITNIEVKVVSQ